MLKHLPEKTPDNAYVYIIIVNYKKWEDARECLDFLFRSDYQQFSVILVDNDSRNESLQKLMQWADSPAQKPSADLPFPTGELRKPIGYRLFDRKEWEGTTVDRAVLPRLIFVQNDSNSGFAAGNNVALRPLIAADAWVWLLNPDMIVQSDTLSESIRFATEKPFRTISGPVVKHYDPPHAIHIYGGARINRKSGTVVFLKDQAELSQLDYISGGALFTHTAHFREIGLLPEEYFLYWEETDWCFRAKQKGYRMEVCETAICFDKIGTTIGRGFLAEYYYTRNGLLFLSRFSENGSQPRLSYTFLRLLKRVVTGRWNRAWGVYKGVRSYFKMKADENK
jgi:GT2 family glycosyltransferase